MWTKSWIASVVLVLLAAHGQWQLLGTSACADETPVETGKQTQATDEFADCVQTFNELLDQRRFAEAEVVAREARRLHPKEPVTKVMLLKVTYLRFPAIADLLVEVERRQLPLAVQAKVAVIDHFCELTAVQKRKLHLAGQGDIKRFYDRLNVLRLRFEVSAEDWDGELHHPLVAPLAFDQEKDILSNALANGLFNEGSLFAKVLESTLNAEQAAGIAASRPVRQE